MSDQSTTDRAVDGDGVPATVTNPFLGGNPAAIGIPTFVAGSIALGRMSQTETA